MRYILRNVKYKYLILLDLKGRRGLLLRSQVDKIWNAFWTGGISNPLTVIE